MQASCRILTLACNTMCCTAVANCYTLCTGTYTVHVATYAMLARCLCGSHSTCHVQAGFKDVMQQLLPAEQDLKSPLQQPSSDPTAAPEGSSEKQDGKQPQRASSSAKASTDKRIDQGTTKPAGPADKDRQDHGRSQSTRREASRPQPVCSLCHSCARPC